MPFHADDTPGDNLIGRRVVDASGSKIGKVTNVVRDPRTGNARYAVVDLGALKASHYAPLANAYRSATDDLVVDLDKRLIAGAPKANKGDELTVELVDELDRYDTTA